MPRPGCRFPFPMAHSRPRDLHSLSCLVFGNGARGEWRLLAACHNLRKIFRHAGTAGLAAAIA